METTPLNVTPNTKAPFIKTLYIYLVSFVALMMVVISLIDIINITLKTFIFKKADRYDYYSVPAACPLPAPGTTSTPETCLKEEAMRIKNDEVNRAAQRERDLVRDISMLIVGIPLFIFHWRLARRKEI